MDTVSYESNDDS